MMNLKMPISKNITVDIRVTHSTGTKAGEMKVETGIIEIETDPVPPDEYDTYSGDTNTRGRSSLATSRSDGHSAAQVTFEYSDLRLRDEQATTRSDYTDLT